MNIERADLFSCSFFIVYELFRLIQKTSDFSRYYTEGKNQRSFPRKSY